MMRKVLTILSLCFLVLSCKKEDTSYKAEIRIVTLSGIPIQNANVKLTVPVENSKEFLAITNEAGIVNFEIEAKAYYDVKTWKGTYRGCGYVEFIQGENVTKDVIIRTYGDPLNICWD